MDDGIALAVGRIAARFWRVGDRWRHEFRVRPTAADGDERAVAASVEGTPDEPWPASPPLTQVEPVQLADGRRGLLAIGVAGRSHWSASVTADFDSCAIAFDVACRLSEATERLGSTYRLLVPDGGLVIEPLPIDGEPACRILSDDGLCRIDVPMQAIRLPVTVRWRYLVRLA